MKLLVISILSLFLSFSISSAQEVVDIEDLIKEKDNTRESWYTFWGLGYSNVSYDGEFGELIDFIEDDLEPKNLSIYLEILGFYWHLGQNTIGGVVISSSGDRYVIYNEWFQINQYLYSGSIIHYLSGSFGTGLYARGDIGLARYVYQDSFDESGGSDLGIGVLIGGGYSFDFGGTRLLIGANYSFKSAEDQGSNTINFSIGGLF